ncbi:MAG TPA: response regulator [Stellaceae bacterium]|nr:response regulator [Stellaceae bacterium]
MAIILLIDDDERLRKSIGRMLVTAGHQVVEAENGRIALTVILGCNPDMVITDVFMPEKDGIETVKSIRNKFPAMRFLAITGGGRDERFYSVIRNLAAAAVLQKPFNQEMLLAAVNAALSAA